MKRTAAFILMLLFVMSSAGCKGEPILGEEMESKEEIYILQQTARQLADLFAEAEEAYVPEDGEDAFFFDMRSSLQWLLDYHEWLLDQSPRELLDATRSFSYIHYEDGSEAVQFEVFGSQMNVFLLFSDQIWAEDSVCVGIGIPVGDLFRDEEWTQVVRISSPEGAAAYGMTWENGAYWYSDKGRTVSVLTDESGALLLPEQIIYCVTDDYQEVTGQVGADFHRRRMVADQQLQRDEFSQVREYASWLGKTASQLTTAAGSSFLWQEDGRLAVSQERRMELFFEDGICTSVVIPTQEFFPHPTRELAADELRAHWNVAVTWSVQDNYRYRYFFDGFQLSMASFEDGAIPLWETYPPVYGSSGPQAGYAVLELGRRAETVEK